MIGVLFTIPQLGKSLTTTAYSAYPPPEDGSDWLPTVTPSSSPEPTHHLTATETPKISVVLIELDVTFNGIEQKSLAEMQLIPFTEQTKQIIFDFNIELPKFEIPDNKPRKIVLNLPVGVYKLSLQASPDYFRDPSSYLFVVSKNGIIQNSKLPFHFKLISPSDQRLPPCRNFDWNSSLTANDSLLPSGDILEHEASCQTERTIDISAPAKFPEPKEDQESGILSDGYHYVGPKTTQNNQGVRGTNRVVDPNVDHALLSYDEFVAERVYARSAGNSWMEVGWAEVSWRDDQQYIYEYDNVNHTWNFFEQYPLSSGDSVETLVRADGNDYWIAKIWWGDWHELFREYLGFTTATDGFNRGEIYTIDGSHPILPRSLFSSGLLYLDDLWYWWNTRYSTTVSEDSPYECDMEILYYRFTIYSPLTYLPLVLRH